MSLLGAIGFPDSNELSSMLGYVTPEDQAQWEQQKAASDAALDKAREGLTARGLASQSAMPAFSMAEKSITAQMHGEQTAEREALRDTRKIKVTRTMFSEEDVPEQRNDDREMGY